MNSKILYSKTIKDKLELLKRTVPMKHQKEKDLFLFANKL